MLTTTPKPESTSSPVLLPAGRLSAWLRETRLLSENPFLEGGERLFIGARDRALGEWYAEMAKARKHDLLVGATSLQKAIGRAQSPAEFKTRVLSRVEGIEHELREWVAWQTLLELEASGWLPFPLCSLRTERVVTSLVHFHYERGLPQRLPERGDAGMDRTDQKRLVRALRTSGVRGQFAWRRFRSQWERLPWPLFWIDAGPVPSAPAPSNREGSGGSPDGLLSPGALLEAEWYVRYMEKTGRSGSGGCKAESSRGSEDAANRLKGMSDVPPEGAPETSSLKEGDPKKGNPNEGVPEEGRPEVGPIEASDANEKGDEKTGSEENPSEENGPASGAGVPSLPASFIPSGEALLVSRAEWDAITRLAEGPPSKKTRHVLEIRSGRCTPSIPAESDPGTSVRRFVAERREDAALPFPIIRVWEVLPDSQMGWLQQSEKAMEKWRDARVKWVEVGKKVYSDGRGAGSAWDSFLILWPVDVFLSPGAMLAAGYETAAWSATYSNGDPEEKTIPSEGREARRVQEPEREKSSVPGGESSERPEICPEDLDPYLTSSSINQGASANRQVPPNRQVPCPECGAAPRKPCRNVGGARMPKGHAARRASFEDLLLKKTDLPMDVRGRILVQRITEKETDLISRIGGRKAESSPTDSPVGTGRETWNDLRGQTLRCARRLVKKGLLEDTEQVSPKENPLTGEKLLLTTSGHAAYGHLVKVGKAESSKAGYPEVEMNPALYNEPGEWTSVRAGRREWFLEDLFRCLAPYRRRTYEPLLSPIAQTIAIAQEKRYLLQGGHGWTGISSWVQGAEQYILAAPDACLAHIEEKLLSLQGEERATLRSRTMTLLEVYAPGPQAQVQYSWDKVSLSYER
ncbi:hypothetical protein GGQ05_001643 [Salinibacter ruber]|nr:hypothetical protein [Salinibacter ruber]MCS4170177.1 hypothetical protein [Salinibacter ruber]